MVDDPIHYDFNTGTITGGNMSERTGLFFAKLAAKLSGYKDFYGFSYLAMLIRTLFPGKRYIQANMAPQFIFSFPYGDAYWGQLLNNSKRYEGDVEAFLRYIEDVDYCYIDCGANYGYMSAMVSSTEFGSKPAISIEADKTSYEILERNSVLNEGRFQPRYNAIFSKSGEMVKMQGDKHEARSIDRDGDNGGSSNGIMVETIAIRDLGIWLSEHGEKHKVIKLDVEGAEIEAIKGVGDEMLQDSLIVYEDHGSDKEHIISRFLKDQRDMKIFVFDGFSVHEAVDYGVLDKLKTNPRYGYDLLATKSVFWLDKISGYNQFNGNQGA